MKTPEEIAELLIGTSHDINSVVNVDDVTQEWLTEFDELIQQCSVCSWWDDDCQIINSENVCEDCLEEK